MNLDARMRQARNVLRGQQRGEGRAGRGGREDSSRKWLAAAVIGSSTSISPTKTVSPMRTVWIVELAAWSEAVAESGEWSRTSASKMP